MEIQPSEIQRTIEDPLVRFYNSIRSPYTKTVYEYKLKKILCEWLGPVLKGDPELVAKQKASPQPKKVGVKRKFYDADFETRVNEFVKRAKNDNDWAEGVLVKMLEKLKERTQLDSTDSEYLKPTSIRNYFFPIQKLLEENKVNLAWKSLHRLFPEGVDDNTRAYTRQEIQKMLNHCKVFDRVLILLAASSGIRAGAFTLNWKHLVPVYQYEEKYLWEEQDVTETISQKGKVVCGMIKIYSGSKWEYMAFITPECWNAIEEYRKYWTKEIGKEPKPDDPFFKKQGPFVRPLTENGIRKRMERIINDSSIRMPLAQGHRRYEVPLFNGFRRFFNKANKKALSKNSTLAQLILKENMMGHVGLIKLDKNYFKTHVEEIIEEYLNAVSNLTISDEERVKAENIKLRSERDRYADSDVIKDMQKRLDEMERGRNKRAGFLTDFLLNEKDPDVAKTISLLSYLFEVIHPEDVKQSCLKKFQKLGRDEPLTWDFLDNELAEEQKIGITNLAKILGIKYDPE